MIKHCVRIGLCASFLLSLTGSLFSAENATDKNLKAAFAGESQANRKYISFAKKAEEDGFPQIAKLFRAAAEAEAIHAAKLLKLSGTVKSTEENLVAASAGEEYESTKMYPEFAKQAEKDKNEGAQKVFGGTAYVEKAHQASYQEAINSVKAKKDLPEQVVNVCSVCGHVMAGTIPDECPICKALKAQFIEIK